jgi:hypothetical protein
MLGSSRLEVQFDIEALIFLDSIIIVSWVLPIFFYLQDPENLPSAVVVTGWGLLVILLVSVVAFLHIYLVRLPRRIRKRFEFAGDDVTWNGALNLAEEIQLLDPGLGRSSGIVVAAALLADLVIARRVDIGNDRRREIAFTDSNMDQGAFDPILNRVRARYLEEPETKKIYNWIRMCIASRISLNEGLIIDLASS